MSGALPPVPDLIPIALLKSPREVMGEQRSRRPGQQACDPIDTVVGSRGPSAAPEPPPQPRKARSRRKSDRRREHRRCSTRSRSKHNSSSPERPPRVNPIFVWVRQEDTRIVDVKCEDYDKRNRILLTKTAQGWRAIPRTETLAPALKEASRHHHRRKARKKVRRKSAAVQVDDFDEEEEDDQPPPSPTWSSPVNVESHLPSHKIHVPKKCPSPSPQDASSDSAHAPDKCSDKICDVSPLDNLLAVAEFEFNQHMQSGEWNKDNLNMEQLDNLIESCSDETNQQDQPKTEECDYTEDDDNNLAMDDILTRLEQSLRSPECPEIAEVLSNYDNIKKTERAECFPSDINENFKPVPDDEEPDELQHFFDETKTEDKQPSPEPEPQSEDLVESSTPTDEPTDLSLKPKYDNSNECNNTDGDDLEQPTDLTLPKTSSPVRTTTPRPPSQNSEAIQSPQPSGIPAVPPSPDIVTTSANSKKSSVFLESLLTTTSQKIALNSEVTIIKQKEPLDLGKCRKSASPTVTCSEEVKNKAEESIEPPNKKFKPDDITLKNLLDLEIAKNEKTEKTGETPRLLELLKTDSGPDPLTQLRQILYDTTLNVPDPMLVPKERLSQIISNPGREIPRLLKQRPELRLPEALAFPHLLQDPDILVITLQQLETIILKQNQSLGLNNNKDLKSPTEKIDKASSKKLVLENQQKKKSLDESVTKLLNSVQQESQPKSAFNELASDIDAATTAAFNQMIWLPYLNQLEAMSFGNNPEVMKMLSNSLPMYPGQVPDLNHLVTGRFPPPVNFPMQQPQMNYNSLELSMWQEAMMQANLLRPKIPFEGLNPKHSFRDYLDKINFAASATKPTSKPPKNNLPFYPPGGSYQNSFLNVPNSFQSKQNLQVPHYPHFGQNKGLGNQKPYLHKQRFEAKTNFPFYQHEKKESKQKVTCKPFANVVHQKEKVPEVGKHQPIDLSGSTAPAKLKVKQHLVDPNNAAKLLKYDDVPEVGSTTASVEEMQDAHKHLWHPLFGNQKGYHNPWNWTTVTATGE